eukprot:Pgem_evm1s1499
MQLIYVFFASLTVTFNIANAYYHNDFNLECDLAADILFLFDQSNSVAWNGAQQVVYSIGDENYNKMKTFSHNILTQLASQQLELGEKKARVSFASFATETYDLSDFLTTQSSIDDKLNSMKFIQTDYTKVEGNFPGTWPAMDWHNFNCDHGICKCDGNQCPEKGQQVDFLPVAYQWDKTCHNGSCVVKNRPFEKRTLLGEALLDVHSKVFQKNPREKAAKIIFVLTDGEANGRWKIDTVLNEIGQDYTVIAVGIGIERNDEALKKIARGNKKNVFSVHGFNDLSSIVQRVVPSICRAPCVKEVGDECTSCPAKCPAVVTETHTVFANQTCKERVKVPAQNGGECDLKKGQKICTKTCTPPPVDCETEIRLDNCADECKVVCDPTATGDYNATGSKLCAETVKQEPAFGGKQCDLKNVTQPCQKLCRAKVDCVSKVDLDNCDTDSCDAVCDPNASEDYNSTGFKSCPEIIKTKHEFGGKQCNLGNVPVKCHKLCRAKVDCELEVAVDKCDEDSCSAVCDLEATDDYNATGSKMCPQIVKISPAFGGKKCNLTDIPQDCYKLCHAKPVPCKSKIDKCQPCEAICDLNSTKSYNTTGKQMCTRKVEIEAKHNGTCDLAPVEQTCQKACPFDAESLKETPIETPGGDGLPLAAIIGASFGGALVVFACVAGTAYMMKDKPSPVEGNGESTLDLSTGQSAGNPIYDGNETNGVNAIAN